MDISTRKDGKSVVVSVSGKLDAVTSSAYEKKLNELISGGEKSIVVDFSALEYISSAGLRSILATSKTLKAGGGKIALANIKAGVKEVFDISGFGTIFPLHDSVEAALKDTA